MSVPSPPAEGAHDPTCGTLPLPDPYVDNRRPHRLRTVWNRSHQPPPVGIHRTRRYMERGARPHLVQAGPPAVPKAHRSLCVHVWVWWGVHHCVRNNAGWGTDARRRRLPEPRESSKLAPFNRRRCACRPPGQRRYAPLQRRRLTAEPCEPRTASCGESWSEVLERAWPGKRPGPDRLGLAPAARNSASFASCGAAEEGLCLRRHRLRSARLSRYVWHLAIGTRFVGHTRWRAGFPLFVGLPMALRPLSSLSFLGLGAV